MSSYIRTFYRGTLKRVPLIRNIVFFGKIRWRYLSGRYCRWRPPVWRAEPQAEGNRPKKIAVISDSFTWNNLKRSLDTVYLTPSDWWNVMERERPELLFCEAAWEGLDGCWDNEILRNEDFRTDNRQVLRDILKYCRAAGIPTVFWNKEDAPQFDAHPKNFVDTALWFDHIFTTAAECIPKYHSLGHRSVHLMMFGFQPELFYPAENEPQGNTAVFLGSWYGDWKERCEDMHRIFQMVLDLGLELRIYDRMSERGGPNRQYPPEYRPFVRPAVPYEQTGELMRRARYVININTVKDSETMFARRVFEAMACGRVVISNESKGLRKLFPDHIWFVGDTFEHREEARIVRENLETVCESYTFEKQFIRALKSAGIY